MERGSGITLGLRNRRLRHARGGSLHRKNGQAAAVVMDGGTLQIAWNEADNHISMTGPAEKVFDGEIII